MCPLYATATGRRAQFRVSGRDFQPPEWARKPPSRRSRLRFYKILGAEVYNAKMASLAAGEDRHGDPLAPVKQPRSGTSDWHGRPYRRGSGPPLMPYGLASRARNLLRVRTDSRSVVMTWVPARLKNPRPGGPKTYPELLVIHAAGGRTGVVRDIIGLSPERLLRAYERAVRRWRLGESPRPAELPNTSRAGATARQSRRPEPDRRVTTRLGRGARPGAAGPMLIQRIAGVFGF